MSGIFIKNIYNKKNSFEFRNKFKAYLRKLDDEKDLWLLLLLHSLDICTL